MEVILDSSFVISCVRGRIDFLDKLKEMGFTPKVPREVLQEMKDLRNSDRVKREEKVMIDVAIELLSKKDVKKIPFGTGKVDDKLIQMGKKGTFIATLDREIKRSVPNRVVISSAKNDLVVERD
jgi:rRNA-processing protein FCF1